MAAYDPITGTKKCGACREILLVDNFPLQKNHGSDPYANRCRKCQSAHYKKWMAANRERKLEYLKKRRRENLAKYQKYDAARWQDPAHRARCNEVRKANKERYDNYPRARRARKAGASGAFDAADIRLLHKKQRGRCAICKKSLRGRWHVDHVMPLFRGGSNRPENLQLLCPSCNVKKGWRDPIEHMQTLGFLL